MLFAFGQSNSANAAQDRYVPVHDIVNLNPHDGRCYRAEDPLLGPDGVGGSVWGRVADGLVHAGLYRQAMIVPIGIGGTNLARWVPGADLHARVEKTAELLARLGIRPTHVLWHQGESDVFLNTATEEYVAQFGSLAASLPALGIDAPVWPAVATRCNIRNEERIAESADRIRLAQQSLPERFRTSVPARTPTRSAAHCSGTTAATSRTRASMRMPGCGWRRCGRQSPPTLQRVCTAWRARQRGRKSRQAPIYEIFPHAPAMYRHINGVSHQILGLPG